MCLSWITAEDRGLNARSRAQLAALGALLRSLHERESAELDWERPPDAGAYLSQRVHEDVGRKLPPPEGSVPVELAHRVWRVHALALAGAIAGLASGVFDSVSASSLLHGDLSGGNVLWSSTAAWLVDWEDARLGDPAEDLAYLFFENQLDSRERGAILHGYGQCGDIERRVGVWEAVVAMGSIAWWLDRYVKASRAHSDLPSAPDYYLSAARERVEWLGA
jgi:aminoglycoside phosphotransferase (APT) family kinase protein